MADNGSNLVLQDSMVYNNSADRGGGMYINVGQRHASRGQPSPTTTLHEGADLLSD